MTSYPARLIINISNYKPGEGTISFGQLLSPFWYRRICEITAIIALVIVGLYMLGRFGLGIEGSQVFFVPNIVLYLALATGVFSLVSYMFVRDQRAHLMGSIAYIAICITVGLLVILTGGISSPFIAMWLVVMVFAGLFGWSMLLGFGLLANTYGAYMLINGLETGSAAIGLILVVEVPLIASAIIWHHWRQGNPETQAVSALEQQLSQVSSKSDIIINSIADGVVVVDTQGIIELVNPAAQTLLGWPNRDAVGLDYRSVIKLTDQSGNTLPDELSPIRQVIVSSKSAENNNLTLTTKSGKKAIISLMVSPVGQSSQDGVIAVFRDITREKEEERQKAEFISTASHEMRTPVAAIEGYLGLAMNPQTAVIDEKARMYLQKAHESTQHLGRLFQDLLTVSKAEDARLIPRQGVIDIVAFTREVVDGLSAKAKEKGLFVNYAAGDQATGGDKRISPMYYVYADPDQLREVISNLLDNAIKYTRQGSVTIDITGDTDNVAVSITDTGIGIPPEDLPHLFQKFYRVDNSDTREIGGTGLGLYISRRLIEANSGRMSVTSSYGKGSTFTVYIPRISNERATEILSTPQPGTAAPIANIK